MIKYWLALAAEGADIAETGRRSVRVALNYEARSGHIVAEAALVMPDDSVMEKGFFPVIRGDICPCARTFRCEYVDLCQLL